MRHLTLKTKFLQRILFLNLPLVGLILYSAVSISASPVTLDSSFGTGGKVITSLDNANDKFLATAIQPDGKIVAVGFIQNNGGSAATIVRYNANGTLDTSFNGTGKIIASFGISGDAATAVAIQPDGKIVIAGNTNLSVTDFLVARYNSDGSLDTAFNNSGYAITPVGNTASYARSIAIQADGKIVAGGVTYNGTTQHYDFALVRYNQNGTLDASFDGDGIATASAGNSSQGIYSLAIQTDGKIVAAGTGGDNSGYEIIAVIRFNADGSLDTSFNGTGKVFTQVGENTTEAKSAAIQADGKILVAGRCYRGGVGGNYDSFIVRYNANGSLDTTFNETGAVITPTANSDDAFNAVAIQTDGKIIAAGYAFIDTGTIDVDFTLVRYNANGTLDTSFDNDGIVTSSITDGYDTAEAIAIQTDGKIILAGWSGINGNNTDSVVARYSVPRTVKTKFDFDGDLRTDVGIFRPSGGEWWIYLGSLGQTLALQFGTSSDKVVPADYTGDGKTDIAIWREATGQWFVLRSDDLSYYAFPFGASGDIPVPDDYDGDGRADAAVFRPSTQTWFIQKSSGGTQIVNFGAAEDKPVVADYDGDGKADIAIFRPSEGRWYILRSEDSSFYAFPWGNSTDIPAPGDYDGDGRMDAAVFRPTDSVWYILRSTGGFLPVPFGAPGDRPIPNSFVR